MQNMRILKPSFINTTTMISASFGNSLTYDDIFDHDPTTRYTTVGCTSNTADAITVTFATATAIDKILLQNHNLKDFTIYYDGTTTNQLASFTSQSVTAHYLSFSTVTVSSVTLRSTGAQTSDTERLIGEFYVGGLQLAFERNPTIGDYTPTIYRKQVRHEMPDGGTALYNIDEKFRVKIRWKYITESFKDGLFDAFNTTSSFYFVPNPTTTAWNGDAYDMVFYGPFNFKYADNNMTSGFSGDIALEETP